MKKVIILNGKHCNYVFDTSTPQLEAESYIKIIKINNDLGYYDEVQEQVDNILKERKYTAAKRFVNWRGEYEYETYETYKVN